MGAFVWGVFCGVGAVKSASRFLPISIVAGAGKKIVWVRPQLTGLTLFPLFVCPHEDGPFSPFLSLSLSLFPPPLPRLNRIRPRPTAHRRVGRRRRGKKACGAFVELCWPVHPRTADPRCARGHPCWFNRSTGHPCLPVPVAAPPPPPPLSCPASSLHMRIPTKRGPVSQHDQSCL